MNKLSKEKFQGVKLSFHILNEEEIRVELEGEEGNEEEMPGHLINLLSYIRGEEGLKAIIGIFKDVCKSLKRKDLYRTFSILLKTLAIQRLTERDAPMISSTEVLGRKRMS